MLAHKATHEGRTAVEAIAGHKGHSSPRDSAVVFYRSRDAWCGLTETQAQRENREIKVAISVGPRPAAMTVDRTEGMTKLVLDRKASACWASASWRRRGESSLPKGVLAVEMAALAKDLL